MIIEEVSSLAGSMGIKSGTQGIMSIECKRGNRRVIFFTLSLLYIPMMKIGSLPIVLCSYPELSLGIFGYVSSTQNFPPYSPDFMHPAAS